jgi:hypothetical protein
MPVVPTTAYSQAEDALNLARALVNDSAGVVFTDTMLMPLLNSVYRGLQRALAENGVSVLVEQQDIELDLDDSTGVTNTEISDVSSPQLPADCLMPHMLWERATANTSAVFVPMEKFTSGGGMLNLEPSSYLRLWEWREDKINLIGATQSITVACGTRKSWRNSRWERIRSRSGRQPTHSVTPRRPWQRVPAAREP